MTDIIAIEKKIINTEHKYVNLQIGITKGKFEECSIFKFNVSWNRRVDHAGFNFDFGIWNFYIFFQIYDNRHWCYVCNKWMTQECYNEGHKNK